MKKYFFTNWKCKYYYLNLIIITFFPKTPGNCHHSITAYEVLIFPNNSRQKAMMTK